MSSVVLSSLFLPPAAFALGDEIGALPAGERAFGRQRLPTDPIGATTVTFSGINAGSEIRVYLPNADEAAGTESCIADQVLSWPVYAAGSPNNIVRVVIVHPAYKIKEFTYTAAAGATSLPVQQERDPWYFNPV